MTNYMITEKQSIYFNKNIDYIKKQMTYNLNNTNKLRKNCCFEMSNKQIINCFKEILSSVTKWQKYFYNKDIDCIQREYKELESNMSELELCLADYDNLFHCEGMSYSLHEIGKVLIEILTTKESDNDGR